MDAGVVNSNSKSTEALERESGRIDGGGESDLWDDVIVSWGRTLLEQITHVACGTISRAVAQRPSETSWQEVADLRRCQQATRGDPRFGSPPRPERSRGLGEMRKGRPLRVCRPREVEDGRSRSCRHFRSDRARSPGQA